MVETATEIEQKVNDQEGESATLFTRMDDDFRLWDLEATNVQDYDAITKSYTGAHDTDINITSNDPRTFANHVQSRLSAAEMQIIVRMAEEEGEDKRGDIAKLERLFHFALEKADERLVGFLLPPLRDSLIWYGMIRGWMAGRILVYKDRKNVTFDFLPLDRRWLTYEIGGNGYLWVANKMFKSKAQLQDEWSYEGAAEKGNNPVIDYWKFIKQGEIENSVIFKKDFLKKPQKHEIPSMPFIIIPVSTRPSVITDMGAKIAGYGDSIYAPNRHVYEVLNKLLSMWATHANILAKQPTINYMDDQGVELKTTTFLAEAVVNLPKDHNKLEASPLKEISPTLVNLVSYLSGMKERGSTPNLELGKPPASGTALNLMQEWSNTVFNPQLWALSRFYGQTCRLVEEQLLYGKYKVKVETELSRKYYSVEITPVDLKRPHVTKVEFTAQTPWTQMDTYQIADMAKRLGLPDEFIWEYILKVTDPKGLADKTAIEIAEHSPTLSKLRAIRAMLKLGRREDAEELMRQMFEEEQQMGMQQQMVGQPQLQTPQNPMEVTSA